MSTGHDMRAMIERAGISQMEAARRLGIDPSTLRRYLARRDKSVPRPAWLALCAVCGLAPLRSAARDLIACVDRGEDETGPSRNECMARLRACMSQVDPGGLRISTAARLRR
jgi:transcriptional regulator with XRE-family HTH domain